MFHGLTFGPLNWENLLHIRWGVKCPATVLGEEINCSKQVFTNTTLTTTATITNISTTTPTITITTTSITSTITRPITTTINSISTSTSTSTTTNPTPSDYTPAAVLLPPQAALAVGRHQASESEQSSNL